VARIPFLAASGIAALVVPPAQVAIAADYMSVDAAQRGFFGQADRFEEVVLALNPDQKQAVTQLAGPQPPHRSLRAWKAMRGNDVIGYVFVDEVLGRQDMITYAVAIDATGKMTPIEVLSYRESHGGEIRGTAWRHQFDGRQGLEHLRFGTDIKNIAGATLSCEHVTQGVRWVRALWQVTLRTGTANATVHRPAADTTGAVGTGTVGTGTVGAGTVGTSAVGAGTPGADASGAGAHAGMAAAVNATGEAVVAGGPRGGVTAAGPVG